MPTEVNSHYTFITDSVMRFSFRFLAAIAVTAASGITYAQSSGTAFVVAPGLLVTNHHVIDGCGAIDVIAADGRRPVTVVDAVEQIDLALLRVYGLRGGVASLRTKSAALLGESATVFGFPLGGALSSTGNFTTGVVSSLRGLRDAAGEIQITAPVQPGNSGGPVLDRSGAVIGVVQSKLDALKAVRATGDIPQNVNFAVSLDVLADFLEKNNIQFKSVERQPAIETTQVAEMAQSFTYKIICTEASRTTSAQRPQTPTPAAPTQDKLVQDIQAALNQKGFNAGPADGFIGPQTKAAIIAAQQSLGIPSTGLPSNTFLSALLNNTQIRVQDFSNDLRDCIFPNVPRRLIDPSSSSNSRVHYRVRIDNSSGGLFGITLIRSSGVEGFDQAVYEGIRKCVPFPRPAAGYPSMIDISYGL